jgi:hypothetical protein
VQVAALSLAWRKDAAAEVNQSRKFSKHPPSRRTELYLLICGNTVWGVSHHKRDTASALRGAQRVGGGVCMLLISAGATHGHRR